MIIKGQPANITISAFDVDNNIFYGGDLSIITEINVIKDGVSYPRNCTDILTISNGNTVNNKSITVPLNGTDTDAEVIEINGVTNVSSIIVIPVRFNTITREQIIQPDNTSIGKILTKVDTLENTVIPEIIPPDNASIADILEKVNTISTDENGLVLSVAEDISQTSLDKINKESIDYVSYKYKVWKNSQHTEPLPDVLVWVREFETGKLVAVENTNLSGEIEFMLKPGFYNFYRQKSGWIFTNPDFKEVA